MSGNCNVWLIRLVEGYLSSLNRDGLIVLMPQNLRVELP